MSQQTPGFNIKIPALRLSFRFPSFISQGHRKRCVSLSNTDLKILAKLLAQSFETLVPAIISSDQIGFIKNQYSSFNVRGVFYILFIVPHHPIYQRFLYHLMLKRPLIGNTFSTLWEDLVFTSWIKTLPCLGYKEASDKAAHCLSFYLPFQSSHW